MDKQTEKKAMEAFQEVIKDSLEWNWLTFDSIMSFVHMVSCEMVAIINGSG